MIYQLQQGMDTLRESHESLKTEVLGMKAQFTKRFVISDEQMVRPIVRVFFVHFIDLSRRTSSSCARVSSSREVVTITTSTMKLWYVYLCLCV